MFKQRLLFYGNIFMCDTVFFKKYSCGFFSGYFPALKGWQIVMLFYRIKLIIANVLM